MFRFLLGLTLGVVLGAFGMAYLWWKDEQERAGAAFAPPSPQQ